MIRRQIGRNGPQVNAIGLGCMGMSFAYGQPLEEKDATLLLHAAIENGVDHFDTAELYGMGANERLLGGAFHDRRDKVFIATKFGPRVDPETKARTVDGSAENAARALEQSLRHLRTDHIDLWYLHRRDRSRPIEETVGAMGDAVKAGKVRTIGLSEVTAETLRKAHAIHPIAAVQTEYSIFTRDVEHELLPACRELDVTLVAYAPLGRGMLTGSFSRDWQTKGEGWDFRKSNSPRFQGEAFESNLALVEEIKRAAAELNALVSHVALAWVLSRGDDIVTIPGTTRLENLKSNLGAADVKLTDDQSARLNTLAEKVKGTRYDEVGMKALNG